MAFWCCSTTTAPRLPDKPWSWLVCVVSTLAIAVVLGVNYAYAVFLPVYLDLFNDSSLEKLSAVGSVPQMLQFFCVPLCYKITELINFRRSAVLGIVLCASSLLVTSFIEKNASILFITYSIPYGLGSSTLYTSCVFATTTYSRKRQNLSIGILVSGISLGILTLLPLSQVFLNHFGLKTTLWILSGTVCSLILPVCIAMDTNVKDDTAIGENQPEQQQLKNRLQEYLEIFKRPVFLIVLLVIFLESISTTMASLFLIKYCIESGLTAQQGANQFILIGVVSIVSSILGGRIMDHKTVNPFQVNQVSALITAVSLFLIQLATKYYHFLIFSLFYGFGVGLYYSTVVVLFLNSTEQRLVKYAWPTGECVSSAGKGVGPPFIGFLIDVTGSYKKGFITGAGIMMLSFFIPFLLYCFKPWRETRQRVNLPPTEREVNIDKLDNLPSSNLNNAFIEMEFGKDQDSNIVSRKDDMNANSVINVEDISFSKDLCQCDDKL